MSRWPSDGAKVLDELSGAKEGKRALCTVVCAVGPYACVLPQMSRCDRWCSGDREGLKSYLIFIIVSYRVVVVVV